MAKLPGRRGSGAGPSRVVTCPWCLQDFDWPDRLMYVSGINDSSGETSVFTSAAWAEMSQDQRLDQMETGYITVCPHSPRLRPPLPPPPAGAGSPFPPDGGLATTGLLDAGAASGSMAPGSMAPAPPVTPPVPDGTAVGAPPAAAGGGWSAVPLEGRKAKVQFEQRAAREGFHELPRSYGAKPTFVVALVGEGDSGKSTLLGSIIGLLRQQNQQIRRYEKLGFEFSSALDHAHLLDDDRVLNLHLPPHSAPEQNRLGSGRLVFINVTITVPTEDAEDSVARTVRAWRDRLGIVDADQQEDVSSIDVTVVLVDLPGESFENTTQAAGWARVVTSADAFMILQDPMEVEQLVQEAVGAGDLVNPNSTSRVLGVLRDTIMAATNADQDMLAIPAALVITKADVLDEVVGWPQFEGALVHRRVLGEADMELTERGVQEASADNYGLMYMFGGSQGADDVLELFHPMSIHLVSAMGCAPTDVERDRQYPHFRPRNALDPLVTLLWQWAQREVQR